MSDCDDEIEELTPLEETQAEELELLSEAPQGPLSDSAFVAESSTGAQNAAEEAVQAPEELASAEALLAEVLRAEALYEALYAETLSEDASMGEAKPQEGAQTLPSAEASDVFEEEPEILSGDEVVLGELLPEETSSVVREGLPGNNASTEEAEPMEMQALRDLENEEASEEVVSIEEEVVEAEAVGGAEEVDADELAMDVAARMAVINQDLSLVADVFLELEPQQRAMLLKQLRYASDMVAFLERLK
ncbi:MAG: hypothetical protein FWC28_01300 [Proteobacteria bacterium]|nr:hypothetical protein [Cystobacterineae bacterium]MCL2259620.1 hypothetical protein [Cystobacterineae bacterium]MCL2313875.1 hypothetical protein [Pseudomonadota bacterium]